MQETILDVENLKTTFWTHEGTVTAVNDVSFQLKAGEVIGLVGESGSGKSQIFMSLMGLLARNGTVQGSVKFKGQEILGLPMKKLNTIRGAHMSMIFQDPMTSLNPNMTIARQMEEVLELHKGMSQGQARKRSIEMLDLVRIPEAAKRVTLYPHEFSGGMRQRVMIAMSLLCQPELLIADEPTTALDVTVQAQILDLLDDIRREFDTSVVLITHDMGVIARLCEKVMVMYAGRIVERGHVDELFYAPQHPYTEALLKSVPRLDGDTAQNLFVIPGQPPNLLSLPQGCAFQDRCTYTHDRCGQERPLLREVGQGHSKACHREKLELAG